MSAARKPSLRVRPSFPIRTVVWLAGLVAAGALLVAPARADDAAAAANPPPPVSPQEIEAAIQRGVKYLYAKQKPDGRWEDGAVRRGDEHAWDEGQGDTFGGYTALSTFALLTAGEKASDPRIQKAVAFLRGADTVGTYAFGMRCQVWAAVPNEENRRMLRTDSAKLLGGLHRAGGEDHGMWGYVSYAAPGAANAGPRTYDHSCSQFGVLALWSAAASGAPVPAADWRLLDRAWRGHQNTDGGWSYDAAHDKGGSTLSMTAAGVATLFITQDLIPPPTRGWCNGNMIDPRLEAGMSWIGAHWQDLNAYTLYGIERVGAASGYKYLGPIDWYARGAALLVQRQRRDDGAWDFAGVGGRELSDSALALLFLSHGRAPVLINKFNYGVPLGFRPVTPVTAVEDPAGGDAPPPPPPPMPEALVKDAHWAQRPRDAANLTRFVARNTEATLNWQTVNLTAPVAEMHDAPVMYMSGNEALALVPEQEAKLKLYVEQGGFIMANADCPAPEGQDDPFTASVKQLGARLFGGAFRPLPASHPILAEQQYRSTRWTEQPVVLGLSNGVRELIVLLPSDPALAWHKDTAKADPSAFELGSDVCLYATDKQRLEYKGVTHVVAPPAGAPAFSVRVARLNVGANWNPEPGGWRRLDAILRRGFGLGLAVTPVVPDAGRLTGFQVAHLTGTTEFELTQPQRQELARFVAGGGTLVVDAAGGAAAFAAAADRELTATFGLAAGNLVAYLPPNHAVYQVQGAAIPGVDYRNYMRRHTAGKLTVPRVVGVGQANRVGVFYSHEDLSGGMVGQPVDGVMGYSPESATAIMRNIMLYAATHSPPPPAPPTSRPATRPATVPARPAIGAAPRPMGK